MITTDPFDDHDAWLSCCSSFENKQTFQNFQNQTSETGKTQVF